MGLWNDPVILYGMRIIIICLSVIAIIATIAFVFGAVIGILQGLSG